LAREKQIEESQQIKQIGIFLLLPGLIFRVPAPGQSTKSARTASAPEEQRSEQPPPTIASAVDREISAIEKQIVEVAEAMREDKFNFSPESLSIPGADYKGVRTFALQVKRVAASHYILWSGLTGDRFPENFMGGNGPEDLKAKADMSKFLKDSFALGHKAAATLTIQNMLQSGEHTKSARLRLATLAVAQAYDTGRWSSICG
jgi:hypothetical protein